MESATQENGLEKPKTRPQPKKGLAPRQVRFITEYLKNGGNRLVAAKSAGYKGNDNSLSVIACRMLKDGRSKELLRKHAEGTYYPEYRNPNGSPKLIRDQYVAAKDINVQRGVIEELKSVAFGYAVTKLTHDAKLRALDILSKILRLYDQNTVTNNTLILSGDIGKASEEQLHARLEELRRAREASSGDATLLQQEIVETSLSSDDSHVTRDDQRGAAGS